MKLTHGAVTTPKGNSDYFCVLAVSGSDDLKTMFCMPKKANG
jgi:hypothetical protein